ncbi:hypothetical protein [Pontibacter anaerobius]|uniref:Uncharacterized protein n=1 Tax=Pontibacter anaerobius TaxID=2993940 RepID=A0ABT3RGF8_9BACT|nr:hypothetical protein [Pontibacter anaerobius]MCX2740640.1 hypothetical protein [Pontibacter anaerobius]
MTKTWVKVRDFLPMVALLLLCMLVMPATQAYAEVNHNGSSATVQQQQQVQQTQEHKATTGKTKPKTATTKPHEKSVLDADVLESPLAYFRDAFSSEEEESDTATGTSAVVVTLKALIATLLSTVI